MSCCPDCGEPTTMPLCSACSRIATHLGYTVAERLAMLAGQAPLVAAS